MTDKEMQDFLRRNPRAAARVAEQLRPPPKPEQAGVLPRPLLAPDASEAEIQAAIKGTLEERGYTVWEGPKGSAGGGKIFYTAGVPDLTIFKPGIILWIEVKNAGNGPTKGQLERHAELRAAGFPIAVVWTLDEALWFVERVEERTWFLPEFPCPKCDTPLLITRRSEDGERARCPCPDREALVVRKKDGEVAALEPAPLTPQEVR